MLRNQRGITFLGWIFLLTPVAIVLYAAIRLSPIYLNYMKVVRSLEQTAGIVKADEALTASTIRNTLQKEFDIESLDYPKTTDIVVERKDGKWSMEANYEDLAPLFLGISLLVKFDKFVPVGP